VTRGPVPSVDRPIRRLSKATNTSAGRVRVDGRRLNQITRIFANRAARRWTAGATIAAGSLAGRAGVNLACMTVENSSTR